MKGKVNNLVKKALLGAAIFFGFTATDAVAQSAHIGFMGGPLMATLQSDIGNYKGIMGFNAGLTSDWRPVNNFSLGLDILYAQNGAKRDYTQSLKYNDRVTYVRYNSTDKFSYLQFHLLPKFILPLGSKPIIPYDKPGEQKMFISIFAGPYYAMRTGFSSSGKEAMWQILNNGDTTLKYTEYSSEVTSAEAKMVASDDFGFTAGAGFSFNLNGGAAILSFDGRYTRSLGSLDLKGYYGRQYLKDNKLYTEYANILHSDIGFNVGLKFRVFGD